MSWLPFLEIQKIWIETYRENRNEKDRQILRRIDDIVNSRERRIVKGKLFVQLTIEELIFLKNLYEMEI